MGSIFFLFSTNVPGDHAYSNWGRTVTGGDPYIPPLPGPWWKPCLLIAFRHLVNPVFVDAFQQLSDVQVCITANANMVLEVHFEVTALFTNTQTLKFKSHHHNYISHNYVHKQWTLKHRKTQNGSKSTNHRSPTMTFWTRFSKAVFLRGPLRWLYVAKCNLGKVNLELMLPVVSPSLHMIRGGASLEFTGANYVQPSFLAIVAINAFVS